MCRHSLEHTIVGGNSKVELVKRNSVIQWRDSAALSKSRDECTRAEVHGKLHKNSSVELVSMREFTEELLQLADKFLSSINRAGRLGGLKEKLRAVSTCEPVALATFVDEDEALEQGMRMSRSLRSFKNRPELADLRAKLEAPVSPVGLAVSGVPEISVGPRVLVHGDQGQGKTVLAEAAFLELQGLRANYDADFHRFRASSEQGDSCAAHLLDTFRQSVFFMQLSLECQCKLFVLQFYVQSCVCFINAWLCGINASWANSVYVMCVKCFT
jgi:hypothetical protein